MLGNIDVPTLAIGSLVASLAAPIISVIVEEGVFRDLEGLTLVVAALESTLTLPVASEIDVGMFREVRVELLDRLTLVFDALEAAITPPAVAVATEEGVFREPDGLTLFLDALEAAITRPIISGADEEGVFGEFEGLTAAFDELEASLTSPVGSAGGVGMFRDG